MSIILEIDRYEDMAANDSERRLSDDPEKRRILWDLSKQAQDNEARNLAIPSYLAEWRELIYARTTPIEIAVQAIEVLLRCLEIPICQSVLMEQKSTLISDLQPISSLEHDATAAKRLIADARLAIALLQSGEVKYDRLAVANKMGPFTVKLDRSPIETIMLRIKKDGHSCDISSVTFPEKPPRFDNVSVSVLQFQGDDPEEILGTISKMRMQPCTIHEWLHFLTQYSPRPTRLAALGSFSDPGYLAPVFEMVPHIFLNTEGIKTVCKPMTYYLVKAK